MTDHRIRNVVIVGGGTAGWMAAAAFARFLDNGYARTILVESDEIGTIGVGEATIPPILTFNRMLGINENEFLRATQGTFKLGIEFVNWGGLGDRYFHPFGIPRPRPRRASRSTSSTCASASGGRCQDISAWSHERRRRRSTASSRGPAPRRARRCRNCSTPSISTRALYARFLRSYAEAPGRDPARRARSSRSRCAARTAIVDAVSLEDGRKIEGDLFIDCSGFRGAADRADAEGRLRGLEPLAALSTARSRCRRPMSATPDPVHPLDRARRGWQWRIPLQHRIGNGHVYSQRLHQRRRGRAGAAGQSRGRAARRRRARISLHHRAGASSRGATTSCRIGLSRGFLEPLESTSIHLIQNGIPAAARAVPRPADSARSSGDEYNRRMQNMYEDVRDFIILHYKATPARRHAVLALRAATWRSPTPRAQDRTVAAHGRVFREGSDLFATTSWVAVMLGQNVVPERLRSDRRHARRGQGRGGARADARALSATAAADAADARSEFIARAIGGGGGVGGDGGAAPFNCHGAMA